MLMLGSPSSNLSAAGGSKKKASAGAKTTKKKGRGPAREVWVSCGRACLGVALHEFVGEQPYVTHIAAIVTCGIGIQQDTYHAGGEGGTLL